MLAMMESPGSKRRTRWYHIDSQAALLERVKSDHIISTRFANEYKRRRTVLIQRKKSSFGFTLQTYGIHHPHRNELEVLTYIDYVEYGGPAYLAGVRPGDVILAINGTNLEDATHAQLVEFIHGCGEFIRMVVLFEDCVRKVELHMRTIKLKQILAEKTLEYEQLCHEEASILGEQYESSRATAESMASVVSTAESFGSASQSDSLSIVMTEPRCDERLLPGSLSDSLITKSSCSPSGSGRTNHSFDSSPGSERRSTATTATMTSSDDAKVERSRCSSTVSLCLCTPRRLRTHASYTKPATAADSCDYSDLESSGMSDTSSTTGSAYPSSSSGGGGGVGGGSVSGMARSKSSTSVSSGSDTDSVTPTATILRLAARDGSRLAGRVAPPSTRSLTPLSKSPIGIIPPNQREIREALQNLRPSTPRSMQPCRAMTRSVTKAASAPSSVRGRRLPPPRAHHSEPEMDDSADSDATCREPADREARRWRPTAESLACRFFVNSDSRSSVGSFDLVCCAGDGSEACGAVAASQRSHSHARDPRAGDDAASHSELTDSRDDDDELPDTRAITEIDRKFRKEFDSDIRATSTPKSKCNVRPPTTETTSSLCTDASSASGVDDPAAAKRDSWGKFVSEYQLSVDSSSELSCHYLPSLDEDVSANVRSGHGDRDDVASSWSRATSSDYVTASGSARTLTSGVSSSGGSAVSRVASEEDSRQSGLLAGAMRTPYEFAPGIYRPAVASPAGLASQSAGEPVGRLSRHAAAAAAHSWLHQGKHGARRLSPVSAGGGHHHVPKMHHSFDDMLEETRDERPVGRPLYPTRGSDALKKWLDQQFDDGNVNEEDEVTHL
ncbi:PREDICTED: uncharacterized protein LOC106817371 [Priapulus caudatus]|uniref:Uncharacterized protein LOC106817371 n=1 Tax=Priapulus caudatus TaxID=37621 RepID=A0ABM1EZ97_PRICU|nr:PREDICTED: uncharacterized protein LOC106817371 [Priapulus caudatus]